MEPFNLVGAIVANEAIFHGIDDTVVDLVEDVIIKTLLRLEVIINHSLVRPGTLRNSIHSSPVQAVSGKLRHGGT